MLTHCNQLQELDPFDLKPTRIMCWHEINPAFKGYSASPNAQYDAVTGEWINYTMEVGYQSTKYHFFSLSDRDPKGTIIASVVADTSYVHSFALTPNYIILASFILLTFYCNTSIFMLNLPPPIGHISIYSTDGGSQVCLERKHFRFL
jgi:carotenoid cleavage dioxygenase-like enzyme